MTRQIPRHRLIVGFIIAGLRIYDVESESDWKRFLELPVAVYRGDARYTAIDAAKERASVCRPKFDGRQRVLIGLDGDRCVARVVTRLSPTLNDESGLPVGMLGFFEALDEPDAVSALLDEAASWLRSSGAGEIVGPMDGDTWHRYRFNIGPFERPLFMLEPYNKPGYGAAWEQCGFEPLESYFSTVVDDVTPAHQALAPRLATIGEHGYQLRQFDPERFHDELRTLHALSCDIFAENLLYDPISEEDFIAIYDGVRPKLDPSLVWFAHHQGKPAGFVFSYLGGDAVNIKSLGVTADHRRVGLGGALAGRVYQSMVDKGIRKVNLCLIRDGNPSGRLEGGVGKVFRRYVLYRYGSVSRGPMKEP